MDLFLWPEYLDKSTLGWIKISADCRYELISALKNNTDIDAVDVWLTVRVAFVKLEKW